MLQLLLLINFAPFSLSLIPLPRNCLMSQKIWCDSWVAFGKHFFQQLAVDICPILGQIMSLETSNRIVLSVRADGSSIQYKERPSSVHPTTSRLQEVNRQHIWIKGCSVWRLLPAKHCWSCVDSTIRYACMTRYDVVSWKADAGWRMEILSVSGPTSATRPRVSVFSECSLSLCDF